MEQMVRKGVPFLSKQTKKIPIYPIPGDTVRQRKCAVQQLLNSLGCGIDLRQITQTQGVLSVRWEPPFTDQLLQHMETFARYGAVFFGPSATEAKLAYIDLVFEREGGLFMDDLIIRSPVILESLDRLPALLSSYVQMMQVLERKRAGEALPEPEPDLEQQTLW
jgi:hypothetical protein